MSEEVEKVLEVTKGEILKAAKKSHAVKEALKELFPEVFDNKYFNLRKLEVLDNIEMGRIFTYESSKKAQFYGLDFLSIRVDGNFAWKGFFLDKSYKWEIVTDDKGALILLPTKRGC